MSGARGRHLFLVPHTFRPGREWLLALRSGDGHWASLSPYFPEAPGVSSERWAELEATSESG